DPAYLAEEVDLEAMAYAFDLCREIGESAALDEWRGSELYPGPGVRSRDEIRDYLRQTCITYHHQVGTCRMGVDAGAVVDPELRVAGVEGLRVADASVMPSVSSGNTHAPTTMIGERAADLVLASLGSRTVSATASASASPALAPPASTWPCSSSSGGSSRRSTRSAPRRTFAEGALRTPSSTTIAHARGNGCWASTSGTVPRPRSTGTGTRSE